MRWRLFGINEAITTVNRIFFREPRRRDFKAGFSLPTATGYVIEDVTCRVTGEIVNGFFEGEVEALGCVWTIKGGRLADVREVEAGGKRG